MEYVSELCSSFGLVQIPAATLLVTTGPVLLLALHRTVTSVPTAERTNTFLTYCQWKH